MSEPLALLTFRLGDQRYALKIDDVIEVAAMVAVQPLVADHPALLGFINRRGNPLPLLDLRQIFGKTAPVIDAGTLFVVVSHQQNRAALVVDEVQQVTYTAHISPAPQGTRFVSGVATIGTGELVQLIQIAPLLAEFLPSEIEV